MLPASGRAPGPIPTDDSIRIPHGCRARKAAAAPRYPWAPSSSNPLEPKRRAPQKHPFGPSFGATSQPQRSPGAFHAVHFIGFKLTNTIDTTGSSKALFLSRPPPRPLLGTRTRNRFARTRRHGGGGERRYLTGAEVCPSVKTHTLMCRVYRGAAFTHRERHRARYKMPSKSIGVRPPPSPPSAAPAPSPSVDV